MKEDNLKGYGFHERTAEEQREIARMGGKASGIARRKKAEMKKAMEAVLSMKHKYKGGEKTGEEIVSLSLFAIASNPKNKASAVAAYREILRVLGQDVPQVDDDALDTLKQILAGNRQRAEEKAEK